MSEETPLDEHTEENIGDEDYDAASIKVLQAWRPCVNGQVCTSVIRMMAPAFITVYEVVDNAIDEALAGYCDLVRVTLTGTDRLPCRTTGEVFPSIYTRRKAFLRPR